MKSVGDQLDGTKKLEIKHNLHDLKKVQYGNAPTFCQSSMSFVREGTIVVAKIQHANKNIYAAMINE